MGVPLDAPSVEILWILTASLFPVGGICGSLLVGKFLAKFGRRNTLIYIQSLCLTSAILMSTAYLSHSYESVIIGRFLMGMFCALVLGSGPIYVSEILPPHLRAPI
uniref:Major facilitator superfamily (MFS) profile domain-containing protein n=1 Tax=Ciona intestinalis TaxID=7719 RepID=F6RTI2_CIOIN